MGLEQAQATRMARSTAEGAALLRAAGHLVGGAYGNPDGMAAAFIPTGLSLTSFIRLPLANRLVPVAIEKILPGGLWFEVVRTRGMDDLVREQLAAGVRQVVLLGAGLDSRAYRMEGLPTGTTFFEVDHPTTAAYKRERVRAVVGEPPAHVRYVEVDFDDGDVDAALAGQGFDRTEPAVLLWSGVTPYLQPSAVDRTLDWVGTLAPGSVIGFDYLWQEYLDGQMDCMLGAKQLRRHVERLNEPFHFGIPRDGAGPFLTVHGLKLVEDLDAAEAMRRYLTREDGSVVGAMWGFGGVAIARVPE